MPAIDGLDEDQEQKLQSFIDVTNWENDVDSAIALLSSAEWNVEVSN